MSDVFLLSPAFSGGRRATMLLRPQSTSALAERLRAGTLSLGEAFAFLSGLYFRGKLSYATTFATEPGAYETVLVITPTRGLVAPGTPVTAAVLEEFAGVDLESNDPRYRGPLERDAASLAIRLAPGARVILLGSIASDKYAAILRQTFGARLHYPVDFIGRGDMSRGGLLLRSARANMPLEYVVLDLAATRRGRRPPRLAPEKRAARAGT